MIYERDSRVRIPKKGERYYETDKDFFMPYVGSCHSVRRHALLCVGGKPSPGIRPGGGAGGLFGGAYGGTNVSPRIYVLLR